MINRLTTLYVRWRYLVLLVALLLVLVVQPVSFGFSTPPQLFDAFLMLVTVALLLSFCPDRNRRLVAIAFADPAGLLSLGGHLLALKAVRRGRERIGAGPPGRCRQAQPFAGRLT